MKLKIISIAMLALLGIAAMGASCGDNSKAAKQQKASQELTASYQERLTNAVPYPIDQMNYSTERANLRERLLRFNDPSKIGYIYLLNNVGNVISYFTIKGKVSNPDSQLTTMQINIACAANQDGECVTNDSIGDDGSYGPNEQGMFFFTTEGVMIEWSGQWLYSDYPLTINEQPIIGYNSTAAKPSNVANIP